MVASSCACAAETPGVRVRRDLEYVFAQQRLAARQYEQRLRIHLANLIDHPEAFFCGELVPRFSFGDASGADVAVLAAQVALFRQILGDDVASVHRMNVEC